MTEYLIDSCFTAVPSLDALFPPESRLRPGTFSSSEAGRRSPVPTRLDDLLQRKGGFFMFWDGGKTNVGMAGTEVTVWTKKEELVREHSRSFLLRCASAGCRWGYGCAFDEVKRRHQFQIELVEGGEACSWVGRDWRRYVPGLYWNTYIGNELIALHKIDVQALADEALEREEWPGGWFLAQRGRPSQWPESNGRIAALLQRTTGFFCLERLVIPRRLTIREQLQFRERLGYP